MVVPFGCIHSIAEQSITAQIPNWLKEKLLKKKNYALLLTGFCLAEASKNGNEEMMILTFLHNDSQLGGLAAGTHMTCMKIAPQKISFVKICQQFSKPLRKCSMLNSSDLGISSSISGS